MSNNYPEFFLRGLSSCDCICGGLITAAAFQFIPFERSDNMLEASINWMDDEGAIDVALSQKKKDSDKVQFSAGLAKINLKLVQQFLVNIQNSDFSYERAPLNENKYHGNLLLRADVPKQIRTMIINGLALAAGTNIISQRNT